MTTNAENLEMPLFEMSDLQGVKSCQTGHSLPDPDEADEVDQATGQGRRVDRVEGEK